VVVLDRGRIVQEGTPEDIYHRPATPFVARFTGIAGELAGTAGARVGAGAGADRVSVEVAGAALSARAADRIDPGQAVRLLVRPAATGIVGAGAPAGAAAAAVTGTVVDVAYRGRGYDHVVTSPAGTLAAVFSPHRWERGSAVSVTVDPAGCSAYPEQVHNRRVGEVTAVRMPAVTHGGPEADR
ncbi:MAG TPA: TOBE domain-containing protein, partial [Acidimicrobiales bacterium]|nr:TOBE domain-containing protein [Acidimicrobiales bacterium]